MLNVSRLRVLQTVAASGSFSAAADELSYTQSAVSQTIARLEQEIGAPLLVRDRRRVRPTAAGATLLDHADVILAAVRAAEEDVAAVLGLRAGHLRVASFPSAGSTLMPQAVASFRRQYPDVQLSLTEGEPEDIAPRLRSGELDLALLYEFPGEGSELLAGLQATALLDDVMPVALPVEHAFADKPDLSLWDLRGQDWVQTSASSPCAQHVVSSCRAAGFDPHVAFESDDYETVQGLVAAGVGVALIPRLALTRVHHGIVVRSLVPASPVRRVVAATADEPGVAPSAAAMQQILAGIAPGYADTRGWAPPRAPSEAAW